MNRWMKKVWYTHTNEYYLALEKEGNPSIYNDMSESVGHYTKWNKLVTEGYVLHGPTYIRHLK